MQKLFPSVLSTTSKNIDRNLLLYDPTAAQRVARCLTSISLFTQMVFIEIPLQKGGGGGSEKQHVPSFHTQIGRP